MKKVILILALIAMSYGADYGLGSLNQPINTDVSRTIDAANRTMKDMKGDIDNAQRYNQNMWQNIQQMQQRQR